MATRLLKESKVTTHEPSDSGFAFRMRVVLPARRNISHQKKELRLTAAENVWLVAAGDAEKIDGAQDLLLLGRGYKSQKAAEVAGRKWRGLLERSSALVQLGVDFGDRAAGGGLGGAYQEQLEGELGRPVIYNNYGLQVFREQPWPRFFFMSGGLSVGSPPDVLTAAAETGRRLNLTMSEQEVLAYDLFAASFFQRGSDARYLMLMASLEALIEPKRRPAESIAHVERLIKFTRESGLPDYEIKSMLGSLEWLKAESIGQAGRRLAATLGMRRYMDGNESPALFFQRCYDLRSRLIHGHVPRPSESDVSARAANLEVFVGHLLSGDLLQTVDIETIVAARTQPG